MKANKSILDKITSKIYGRGRGHVFTPKDFAEVATLGTVRRTLARLEKQGVIRRVGRGVYDYPAFSRLFNDVESTDTDAAARAVARAHGWTLTPSGETALNLLGLSTQVPARWEYFTDGPTKRYAWGSVTVVFKRRANKETTGLSAKTALVVQGLKALGQARMDAATLSVLRGRLTPAEWRRAKTEARFATAWVYEVIRKMADTEENHHA